MTDKFQNKYRIKSTRLEGYDYSAPGKYYVTINTKNRQEYFGEIQNGLMNLSQIGEIADACYRDIPVHFKNVTLDEWIIMPDHIHGIIIINNENVCDEIDVDTPQVAYLQTIQNKQPVRNPHHNPEWKPGMLGVIVHQFKSSVTRIKNKKYPT